MKIALIADTHFNEPYAFASVDKYGVNSRFANQMSVWDIIPQDTDILVHLGDLFNSKFRLNRQIYDRVFDSFNKAPGDYKIFVLGNHDYYSFHKEPTLSPFREICSMCVHRYVHMDIGGVRFHCIRYPALPKHFFEDVDMAVENLGSGVNILLAHVGVAEASIGPLQLNLSLSDTVHISELRYKHFDYVFLGHYHKHQQLANNVWYVGSPLQLSFSEREEKKGIMTLDTDNGKLEFVQNTVAPRFHVIKITNPKQLAKMVLNDKDFYRLELECQVSRSILDNTTKDKNVSIEGGIVEKREIRLKEGISPQEIISEYVDIMKPDLDKEVTIKEGLRWLV